MKDMEIAQKTDKANRPCVFVMHGTMNGPKPLLFEHHGLLDADAFCAHLKSREKPYADLASALAGQNDALTIDDATQAACDAAILARHYGHSVTLFINPMNVTEQKPYFFARLSLALDKTKAATITFQTRQFALNNFRAKSVFRQYIKQKLLTMPSESDKCALVKDIAELLHVHDSPESSVLQVIGWETIKTLKKLGVNVANHGWTHSSIGSLPPSSVKREIVRGRTWIARNIGCDTDMYAVPFGHSLPPFRPSPETYRTWFLNDDLLYPGFVGPSVFNRVSLRL